MNLQIKKNRIINRLKTVISHKENISSNNILGFFVYRDLDLAIYTGGIVKDTLRFESMLCLELTKTVSIRVDVRVIDDAPVWFKLKIARKKVC